MRYAILVAVASLTACGPKRPMVRECGAIVGGHFDAKEYSWLQPCDRKDQDGCDARCRPAKDACEQHAAALRDMRYGRDEKALAEIERKMIDACWPEWQP